MVKTIHEVDDADPDCIFCDGCGWVCENHPKKGWAPLLPVNKSNTCSCGAGMPCRCNPLYRRGRAKIKNVN